MAHVRAMAAELGGTAVQDAENNVNLIIAAVVWSLGCVFLARTLFGNGPTVTLTAGILSGAQTAFPYLLYVWGPLFPNALSLSLLPTAMAIAVVLLRASAPAPDKPRALCWVLALVLSLAGMGSAHTSTVVALLLFTMPLIVATPYRHWRPADGARRTTKNIVGLAVLMSMTVIIAALIWVKLRPPRVKLRPPRYDNWGPHGSTLSAIREALTNAPFGTGTNWIVTPLALYGVVVLIRTAHQRWFVVSYGIAVFLCVVDAAIRREPFATSSREPGMRTPTGLRRSCRCSPPRSRPRARRMQSAGYEPLTSDYIPTPAGCRPAELLRRCKHCARGVGFHVSELHGTASDVSRGFILRVQVRRAISHTHAQ